MTAKNLRIAFAAAALALTGFAGLASARAAETADVKGATNPPNAGPAVKSKQEEENCLCKYVFPIAAGFVGIVSLGLYAMIRKESQDKKADRQGSAIPAKSEPRPMQTNPSPAKTRAPADFDDVVAGIQGRSNGPQP